MAESSESRATRRVTTIRLDAETLARLDELACQMRRRTGDNVSRADALREVIALGLKEKREST